MWNFSTLLAQVSDQWLSVVAEQAGDRIKIAGGNIEFCLGLKVS
jgi:hypothetical protein